MRSERRRVWPRARGHPRPAEAGRGKDAVPQESLPAHVRFQEGTRISVVPSHPVCGSWCQPREARAPRGPRLRGCWRTRGWAPLGVSRTQDSTHSWTAQLPSTVEVLETHQGRRSTAGTEADRRHCPGKLTAWDEGTDADRLHRSASIRRQRELGIHTGSFVSAWPPFIYWK